MSNLQTLAAWVGLLGGAAGFISVLLNWWQIRVDSPRIILDLKFAYSTANVKEFCSIEVINKGGKSVTINNVGIRYSNTNHSPFGFFDPSDRLGKSLPFRLDSHSAETWFLGNDSIIAAITEQEIESSIQAYVNLSTGKNKFSKKIKLN